MEQGSSKKIKMKRKGGDFRQNPSFTKDTASPRSPYVGDPRLVPRIQQYLDDRPDNQVINIVTMASELQDKYPAYARKKRIAFVKQVEKAYNIICTQEDPEDQIEDSSCSLEEKHLAKRRKQANESPDDDSDSSASFSDNAEYVTYKDTNSVNSLLTNLYNKNTPGSRPSTPGSKPNSRPRSPVSQPGSRSRSPVSVQGQSQPMKNKPKVIDKTKGEKPPVTISNGKSKPATGQKFGETVESKEEDDIIEMWTIDRNGDVQTQPAAKRSTPKGLKTPTKHLPGGTNNRNEPNLKVGQNIRATSSIAGPSSSTAKDVSSLGNHQFLSNIPAVSSTSTANILDEKVLNQQLLMPHIQYITPETAAWKTNEYLRRNMNISQEPLTKHPKVSNVIDIADSAPGTPKSLVDDGVDIPAETPHGKNESEADMRVKTPKSTKKKKKTGEPEKEAEKKGINVQQSQVKFADIGGNDSTLKEICKLLVHMKHPEVYRQLGVTPPRGFLLHGPPGCGKTLLAHAVAGELEMPFLKLASTEIVSGVSGESEEKIRDLFEKAKATAPCVLFIDEIDAITQKRENASKDMERRIVSQLLTCMDDLNSAVNAPVLVIGATNRADSLDPALRRAGRFDREICLGIPNEAARKSILEVLCRGLRLADDVDCDHLARNTPGFVGADLQSLAREAAMTAVNRIFNEIEEESKRKHKPCTSKSSEAEDITCIVDLDVEDIESVENLQGTVIPNDISHRGAKTNLSSVNTKEDIIVIDNDVNNTAVDSADVEDITEVSEKGENCSIKKAVNCIDTLGDCKESLSDSTETPSGCKETVTNCKESTSYSEETCNDSQNIPNDTKNTTTNIETNVSQKNTSSEGCSVDKSKSDSDNKLTNGQSPQGNNEGESEEVNKNVGTPEKENTKNCVLGAESSPKQQSVDSNKDQSDELSHNASNVSKDNKNEKQTNTEIIKIDSTNLDSSIEEINNEKTKTKSTEKQSVLNGTQITSRSEIQMEVDDDDIITTVKKIDSASTQVKKSETGVIEISLDTTLEAPDNGDDGSIESDDDITDVTEPTEKEQLNTVLSWLRDSPPLSMDQLENLAITKQDFQDALKVVQPSAKREGFATIPDVTWDDIGALREVREELQMAILAPVRHPEQFKSLGLTNPPGILLAGPPGCGKTLLAKAIANESGINFISVKGPELLNMYVGESERAVRQVFQRARNSCPCVIFFDELDALCPKRSHGGEGGSSVRVVNQLLTEMDGLEERKHVYIMAATNRPDIIDPAIMRPGRLDKLLFVGMPTLEDRIDILKAITKNGTMPKFQDNVYLEDIAAHQQCGQYTGADLAALVREASVIALKEFIGSGAGRIKAPIRVGKQHFEIAFHKVKPSVSQKDKAMYDRLRVRSATD